MEDKEKKLALQKAVGERVYHSRKLARMRIRSQRTGSFLKFLEKSQKPEIPHI